VTADVAPGAVFVPFNQPGLAANALLAGGFVEPAGVEPADGVETPTAAVGAEGAA
jgi:hypothetical protein